MKFFPVYEFIQSIMYELGLEQKTEHLVEDIREITKTADIPMNKTVLLLLEARQARHELNMGMTEEKINKAIEMILEWKKLPLLFFMLIERINIYLDIFEIKPTDNNR